MLPQIKRSLKTLEIVKSKESNNASSIFLLIEVLYFQETLDFLGHMIRGKKFLVPGRRLERHCNVLTFLYSHIPTGHAPRPFIELSHGISIYGITLQSPNLRSRVEIKHT